MNVGFIVTGMTSLKYFIPIVEELNRRNKKSIFFIPEKCNGKYNSVFRNLGCLLELCNSFNIHVASLNDAHNFVGVLFQIEGDGLNIPSSSQQKKIALTYMTDFLLSDKYIDKVDYVIFPSKKFADFYKMKNKKYLFLGSPKYDYKSQEKQVIAEKYGIDLSKKIALYMAPNNDYNHLLQNTEYSHEKTIEILKQKGYYVICKSRGKNPITYNHLFDNVIYDGDWFPHPSLEILKISDIMINFNSTAIKEAVLSKVPVIDIKIKKHSTEKDRLDFLYNYKYCFNLGLDDLSSNKIIQGIDHCESIVDEDFQESISNNLFEIDGTCKRIIDFVVNDL